VNLFEGVLSFGITGLTNFLIMITGLA
jgi:hypothetical protein